MNSEQIIGSAEQASGRVQDAVGALNGDVKTQAKGKLKQAAGAAKETYGHLKEVALDAVGQTRETVHVAVDRTKDRVRDGYSDLETFVQNKPGPALAIAAGVGIALGLMLRGTRTVYHRDPR
jgi:uncharacterized protein YjbJ (UPF0337 family)